MSMKRRFTSGLMALALASGVGLALAPAAQADTQVTYGYSSYQICNAVKGAKVRVLQDANYTVYSASCMRHGSGYMMVINYDK
ncbi:MULTISPECIES: hypothetical protein [Glutamicibacter]|uniref:hypothetical protein n=1 Tax=Glutamicibacter TaxID=1742989 RepID=UPI001160EEDB|nr:MULTISPECIES: hypothetical protein [Glutamicibacter]QEP06729.1 hypothetical protein F0M17_05465 [Glutamicibacter sp. ZJUTW]WIV45053.1 hypothetical protein QQS42_05480 [Glutamicibacter nicotianae]